MEQAEISANKREILGKKVRFMRRQGVLPAHVFGHGLESLALECNARQLERTVSRAGATKLLNLKIRGERSPRNVLIREIQRNPVTGTLTHVDFYQVRMAEKLEVDIPIMLVGESPALKMKENILLHELDHLAIECLPKDIPASIEVDVSSLTEAGQDIRVKDIKLADGIIILNDPEVVVASISAETEEEAMAAPAEEKVVTSEMPPAEHGEPKGETEKK